eukprot:Pompholyxophrys_sp_v1_NODE_41_length_3244_cov_6.650361.p1 type:complete len:115 gc:universal NODE_41_length_3244_cov_6.650361:2631-2975(+)
MLNHAEEALAQQKIIKGVKGPTILSIIPGYDIPLNTIIDYMHLMKNIGEKMTSLWFDKEFRTADFSLVPYLPICESFMEQIKVHYLSNFLVSVCICHSLSSYLCIYPSLFSFFI